ncbi:hypothetical protein DPMN_103741 [Dreissena polymorpha]|uniref:Uncharacterized protein n=1 Tax=Dreissena polymorpha TaxID=45954 RepID=A0A9D4K2G8_DREPO|nr:hypothetical protein DPMN_103741 [Dreissena polymorpha]
MLEIALSYWMQACKGCSLSTVSEGCLLCSSPKFCVGDLVYPAEIEDLPDAGVDEDLYLLYGVDSASPGLCSMEE